MAEKRRATTRSRKFVPWVEGFARTQHQLQESTGTIKETSLGNRERASTHTGATNFSTITGKETDKSIKGNKSTSHRPAATSTDDTANQAPAPAVATCAPSQAVVASSSAVAVIASAPTPAVTVSGGSNNIFHQQNGANHRASQQHPPYEGQNRSAAYQQLHLEADGPHRWVYCHQYQLWYNSDYQLYYDQTNQRYYSENVSLHYGGYQFPYHHVGQQYDLYGYHSSPEYSPAQMQQACYEEQQQAYYEADNQRRREAEIREREAQQMMNFLRKDDEEKRRKAEAEHRAAEQQRSLFTNSLVKQARQGEFRPKTQQAPQPAPVTQSAATKKPRKLGKRYEESPPLTAESKARLDAVEKYIQQSCREQMCQRKALRLAKLAAKEAAEVAAQKTAERAAQHAADCAAYRAAEAVQRADMAARIRANVRALLAIYGSGI